MMTAVAIGLIGAGIVLIYAGITGQSLKDELAAALGGGGGGTTTNTPTIAGGGGGTWKPQ